MIMVFHYTYVAMTKNQLEAREPATEPALPQQSSSQENQSSFFRIKNLVNKACQFGNRLYNVVSVLIIILFHVSTWLLTVYSYNR